MYFSQLRVDPTNDKTIYVAGLPVAKSLDGGKTFATLDEAGGNGEPGHVDQHAIWIDPKNPKHIMNGNDGGLNISWDQGKTWDFVNTMATALAYVVTADMRHPYYVYIGLQDNGSWGGPSAVRGRGGIMNSDWFGIGGGDGFHTAVDPTDYNIVIHRIAGRQHEPLRPAPGTADRASGRMPAAARRARRRSRRGRRQAAAGRRQRRRRRTTAGSTRAGRRPAEASAARRPAERAQRHVRRPVSLQLEHAVHPVAAQPEHRLARRQPAVQVVQPAATPGSRARI